MIEAFGPMDGGGGCGDQDRLDSLESMGLMGSDATGAGSLSLCWSAF